MKKSEQIKQWAKDLTPEQMRPLLEELVSFAIDSEMVCFGDLAPYWEPTGDPLIDGQKTHSE